MRKLLSLLLLLALVSSLACPIWAIGGTFDIYGEAVGETVPDSREMVKRVSDLSSRPHTRGNLEDNICFPGPLTEQCAYVVGEDADFTLGAYQTGKTGQYFCILIYPYDDLSGEPLYMNYGAYDTTPGFSTKLLRWQRTYLPVGKYTLVAVTAELHNETLYPVEGTASATEIYFTAPENPAYRKEVFVTDYLTGERMASFQLVLGQSYVFAAGRAPLPSYGKSFYLYFGGEGLLVEEAGGLFFVTPTRCCTGSTRFWYDYEQSEMPLEVCVQEGGHDVATELVVSEAEPGYNGCTLKICGACGFTSREYSQSYYNLFNLFTDLPKNEWFYETVQEAVMRGLFKGVSETSFAPHEDMSRAMLVTVLWRYEGEPAATVTGTFSDVSPKVWYAQAVDWAAEEGIVNGIGKGKFDPDGTITREQLTTILYRYARKKSLDLSVVGDLTAFPDGGSVSSWATDAMAWAVGNALVSGIGKGGVSYLTPFGNATRAQVSTILIRFIDGMMEPEPEILVPDTTDAKYSGTFETGTDTPGVWALYESGLLQVGGCENIHSASTIHIPWMNYRHLITDVEILSGMQYIGKGAFRSLKNLRSVTIPDTVTRIGEEAFASNPSLESVRLPQNLEHLSDRAFASCTALRGIVLPQSLRSLGHECFMDCTLLVDVELPDGLRSMGSGCFKGCSSLKEAVIPQRVLDNMGARVFENCSSLEWVSLPFGATKLEREFFYGCTALKEVELPYALETMGQGIFGQCTSLESLILPPSFRSMYTGTFTQCTSLQNIYAMNYSLNLRNSDPNLTEYDYDGLPFGDPYITTVWGFSDSPIHELALEYGYTFCDILDILG